MLHEISFTSYNERDEIQAWIYVPAAEPKGIVQLIHGFGEHSRRYLHMIVGFLEAGYIVAADDHVGHGKTAIVNDSWGDWGDGGLHTMMEDEYKLTTLVKEKYPDLPYFLYGHSMGSFIARDYMAKYGDEIAGVTLSGTGSSFPITEKEINILKGEIEAGRGKEANPEMVPMLLGWAFERIPEVKAGNEWICSDPYVQIDHAKDPFNAFTKPINTLALYDFMQMTEVVKGKEWAEKVPKDLPIYNIAGDKDPIGNYGQGVYEVSNWLISTGHNVETKLYSGYWHEIHNYNEIKDEVVDGIVEFMDELV